MRGGLLALVVFVSACAGEPAPVPVPAAPPLAVRLATAETVELPIVSEVVGTVRAVRSATIAPLVSGTVAEVRVGLGSAVRAGDVLLRLSAREIGARLEQARAVSALARSERDRAARLRDERAISVAQYEAAVSQYGVAQATHAEASTLVDRTVLRAPFAGVITGKLADVGDTALPGQPLLTLEAPGALRFEARVPDRGGREPAVGEAVTVRLDGVDGELEGRIAEIHPGADEVTRTRLVKIDLPPAAGVRSGRFGRVLLTTGAAATVAVPAEAVVPRGQLETLFVVRAGVAQMRLVRTGRARGGRLEISSGLAAGEQVALAPDVGLADGRRVVEVGP
jgi:RND family efflux transporter MFP subunit